MMPQPKTTDNLSTKIDHLFRNHSGKMVSVLTKFFGFANIQIAEDIIHDTFYAALRTWPLKFPDNPEKWLYKTAKNKALNYVNKVDQKKSHLDVTSDSMNESGLQESLQHIFLEDEITDSQLKMLFVGCDPKFSKKNQIIFTLRYLCGFGVDEIASALLLKPDAVFKSLQRTKKKFKENALSLDVKFSTKRLNSVLMVLYLFFNEGFKVSTAEINKDICFEAIRLAKIICDSKLGNSQSHALLALMFFNMSRFESRLDASGNLVLLEQQERKKWNEELINLGFKYLLLSKSGNELSRFNLEAGIAGLHCSAKSYEETDWEKIVKLYDLLVAIDASPIILLNRCIAIANLNDVDKGLEALNNIEDTKKLQTYPAYYMTIADFYYRKNDFSEAERHYRNALELTHSAIEKSYLENRIVQCQKNAL